PDFSASEGCTAAILTVNRSGDTSGPTIVNFVSSDGSSTQRTDYGIASGTINFAPGETSKTFKLLLTDDAYAESNESVNVALSDISGGSIGSPGSVSVTIGDNDIGNPPQLNPIDDAATFVCQHYHDFLTREPDGGGATFWTNQIAQCNGDPVCNRNKRIDVS